MMPPMISVIVPVYKVEPYIHKCVDSIINQTYTNLEIILVDDGSPDNCPVICDEYAKKDSRIKVIHKENGGVSSARNAGLDAATGDYIGFVDSDDWIKPEMYETLLAAIEKTGAEAAACGYVYYTDETNQREIRIRRNEDTISNGNLIGSILSPARPRNSLSIGPFVWNKLFASKLWTDIRFDTELVISEDMLALLQIVMKSDKLALCEEPLYFYFQNKSGVIGSTDYLRQSRLGCDMLRRIVSWFEQEGKYADLALENLTVSYFIFLNYLAVFRDRKQYYTVRDEFKQYWDRIMPQRKSYFRNYRLALLFLKYVPELYWHFSVYHNRKVKYRI